FNYREEDSNYYEQPGDLFRLMTPEEQQRLFANTARAMNGASEATIERHIRNCSLADPAYGEGVRRAVEALKEGRLDELEPNPSKDTTTPWPGTPASGPGRPPRSSGPRPFPGEPTCRDSSLRRRSSARCAPTPAGGCGRTSRPWPARSGYHRRGRHRPR